MLYVALRMFTASAYICVQLAHVVRIFRTYTDLPLRTLCGFCVRIRICFCACYAAFACVYGLFSQCSMRKVSSNLILRVPQFILSVRKLVISGKS